jgi:polysaccharide export outer membrane protein
MTAHVGHASTRKRACVHVVRRLCAVILSAACAGFTVACAPSLPPLKPVAEGPYRLDTGDRVRVIVFGQKELSDSFTINDGGSISLPLVGQVKARDLTVGELEERLRDAFNNGVLTEPSVNVEVEAFRPFYILGEVARPGQYPYANRMSVLTAVAIAGGFTYRARTDVVSITRSAEGRKMEGRAPHTADVAPGDVIVVDERFF